MTKLSRPIGHTDFRTAPENICTIAMYEAEDGNIFAFGHPSLELLREEIPKLYQHYLGSKETITIHIAEKNVSYSWAKVVIPSTFTGEFFDVDVNDGELMFTQCEKDDPDAFPVTIVLM